MSDDQISLPYFAAILIILGFIVRYLFFNGTGASPVQTPRSPEALLRARETAVERIQQMFPQTDRRTILWDLHRNGMNIQNTTERILAGRLETVSWLKCGSLQCSLANFGVISLPLRFNPLYRQRRAPRARALRQPCAQSRSLRSQTSSRGTTLVAVSEARLRLTTR